MLATALRDLDVSLDKELRWTSDRMIRHTEARDPALLREMHLEVAQLRTSVHKALRVACRALCGKLLPTSAPSDVIASGQADALRKDQVRWLQGCCGALFPHCLVCIFDPTNQDDATVSPWTVLDVVPEAAALAVQTAQKRPGMLPLRVK